MEEKKPPPICPWLGSQRDSQVRWSYINSLHYCWSPQHPREDPKAPCAELSMDQQKRWCLTQNFNACPFFLAPSVPSPPTPAKSTSVRTVCFFLGGKGGRYNFNSQPADENVCFSFLHPLSWWDRLRRRNYTEIDQEHQRVFCLQGNFRNCPFFDQEEQEEPQGI